MRKWKKAGGLRGGGKWEYEVGEEPRALVGPSDGGIMESSSNVSKSNSRFKQLYMYFLEYHSVL